MNDDGATASSREPTADRDREQSSLWCHCGGSAQSEHLHHTRRLAGVQRFVVQPVGARHRHLLTTAHSPQR